MQTWSSSQSTPHTCSPSWGTTVAGAPCHLYIYINVEYRIVWNIGQRQDMTGTKHDRTDIDRDMAWQKKTQNREKTGQGARIEWQGQGSLTEQDKNKDWQNRDDIIYSGRRLYQYNEDDFRFKFWFISSC